MASVRKDILIDVRPDDVWAAIRDYGAVHRLVPGFLTDCQIEGEARIGTSPIQAARCRAEWN